MEWNLFAKIADELASQPLLSQVCFELHNEPLLDERIFGWVKHLKSVSPDKSCAIVTNGELLDRFSLTDLIQSNLDLLVVSLNAHSKEMYESINTGLNYEKVMENVSVLVSNEFMRKKVMLSFVLTEQNVYEVYQATRYWRKQGVKTMVSRVANRAGSLDNYERLKLKRRYYGSGIFQGVWGRMMSSLGALLGCNFPFYQMSILFNGNAILCCHDWQRASVVGSVNTSSLMEIWNSEEMNKIRRSIMRKRYKQLNSCKDCSIDGNAP
jgi:radical SAM protein with 4Fe4S-binding SPASM domain